MLKYFVILLVVFVAGVPVAVAMGGTATLLMILDRGLANFNPAIIAQKGCYGLNNFLLLSIPLFLYAGKIMNTGNITNRIFRFCSSLVGWLHGGLGHVNILASVVFAGMTGTATSDAAGLGAIEIEAMREAGYDDDFTFGVTAGSSLIGPIIPPSIPLVIYGMMTGVSIGKLLVAGIVPGVILAIALGIYVEIVSKKRGYPRDAKFDLKRIWHDFKKAFLSLLTPVIIIGGIMSGVFTATEAAAIAALYATILTTLVYKEVSFKDLIHVLWETVRDSGAIMTDMLLRILLWICHNYLTSGHAACGGNYDYLYKPNRHLSAACGVSAYYGLFHGEPGNHHHNGTRVLPSACRRWFQPAGFRYHHGVDTYDRPFDSSVWYGPVCAVQGGQLPLREDDKGCHTIHNTCHGRNNHSCLCP